MSDGLIFSQSHNAAITPIGFWVSPELRSVLHISEDYLIFADPQLIRFLECSTIEFQAALVWVWHFDHRGIRPDRRNKMVRLQQPYGVWLYSILRLAKECYVQRYTAMLRAEREVTISHPKQIYESADHWFFKIIAEIRSADLALLLQTWQGLNWTKELNSRSQRSLTAKIDASIRLDNPVDPHSQPHLWNLLELSIELSNRSQDWYENFLRGKKGGEPGFIFSHRAFIKSLESKKFQKIDSKENVSKNTKPRKPYTARVTEVNLQKLGLKEPVQRYFV
jgi:hypothetical protein